MIHWGWAVAAFIVGEIVGVFMLGLVSMNRK